MGRPRNPQRDAAKQRFIDSGGTITTEENAALAGVTQSRIRKWKSEDKWLKSLPRRKRGGQPGNKNAGGFGAPDGNKNAETHGAYSTVDIEGLPPEAQERIAGTTVDVQNNLLQLLTRLYAKEADLQARIDKLLTGGAATLHVERELEILVPRGKDGQGSTAAPGKGKGGGMTTAMKTVIRAASFDMVVKLEAELNKTQGRITKVLDTLRAYQTDKQRLNLDRRKHEFAKQKQLGQFNINPETGEIDDEPEDEDFLDE